MTSLTQSDDDNQPKNTATSGTPENLWSNIENGGNTSRNRTLRVMKQSERNAKTLSQSQPKNKTVALNSKEHDTKPPSVLETRGYVESAQQPVARTDDIPVRTRLAVIIKQRDKLVYGPYELAQFITYR